MAIIVARTLRNDGIDLGNSSDRRPMILAGRFFEFFFCILFRECALVTSHMILSAPAAFGIYIPFSQIYDGKNEGL